MKLAQTLTLLPLLSYLQPAFGSEGLRLERQTLVLSGSAAPGTPEGVTFGSLFNARIDELGNVEYSGVLVGPGTDDSSSNSGSWINTEGTNHLLFRSGFTEAGGNILFTPTARTFSGARLLAASEGFIDVLWLADKDGVTPIAIDGAHFPGLAPDETLEFPPDWVEPITGFALNPSGDLAFSLPISRNGAPAGTGLWFGEDLNPVLALRTGAQAPGLPNGITLRDEIDSVHCCTPLIFGDMTDAGEIAMVSTLQGDGVNESNDTAVWFGSPTSLAPVAREGDAAPGLTEGEVFDLFLEPRVDRSSWVTLNAIAKDVESSETRSGVWVSDGQQLSLVAAVGDLAPGFEDEGERFASILRSTAPNAFGEIAFTAMLTSGVLGSWIDGPDGVKSIIFSGEQIPNEPGVQFTMRDFDLVHLDDAGRIVINGYANGEPARWLIDTSGEFHPIAREGELLEVLPGDFRRISDFSHHNAIANYDGQVAMVVFFEDGTKGVFRWQLVPEPSSCIISLLCGGLLFCLASTAKGARGGFT